MNKFLSALRSEGDDTKSFLDTLVKKALIILAFLIPIFFLTFLKIPLLQGKASILFIAILIIAGYNFYISIAKDLKFRRRFLEMALISLGVAAISFTIGFFVKNFFGIEI